MANQMRRLSAFDTRLHAACRAITIRSSRRSQFQREFLGAQLNSFGLYLCWHFTVKVHLIVQREIIVQAYCECWAEENNADGSAAVLVDLADRRIMWQVTRLPICHILPVQVIFCQQELHSAIMFRRTVNFVLFCRSAALLCRFNVPGAANNNTDRSCVGETWQQVGEVEDSLNGRSHVLQKERHHLLRIRRCQRLEHLRRIFLLYTNQRNLIVSNYAYFSTRKFHCVVNSVSYKSVPLCYTDKTRRAIVVQLPNCIYKFHKQSFIVSSVFRFLKYFFLDWFFPIFPYCVLLLILILY